MASGIDIEKFFKERMERRRFEEEKRREVQRQKDREAAKEAYYRYCREIVNNVLKQAKKNCDNPDQPWYLRNPSALQKQPNYHVEVDHVTFLCALRQYWTRHQYIDNVNKLHLIPPPNDFPDNQKKSFALPRFPPQEVGRDAINISMAVPRFGDLTKSPTTIDARRDKIKEIINNVVNEANIEPNFSFKMRLGPQERVAENHTQRYITATKLAQCKETDLILRGFLDKIQSAEHDQEDTVSTMDPDEVYPETKTVPRKEIPAVPTEPSEKTAESEKATSVCTVADTLSSTNGATFECRDKDNTKVDTRHKTDLDLDAHLISAVSGDNEVVRYLAEKSSTVEPTEDNHGRSMNRCEESLSIKGRQKEKSHGILCRFKSRLSLIKRRLFPSCCRPGSSH